MCLCDLSVCHEFVSLKKKFFLLLNIFVVCLSRRAVAGYFDDKQSEEHFVRHTSTTHISLVKGVKDNFYD